MKQDERNNLHRRDSGWLRLILPILFSLISLAFLYSGYSLLMSAAVGDWTILSDFSGWKLYASSASPGLLVIALGALILVYGLPKTLRSL